MVKTTNLEFFMEKYIRTFINSVFSEARVIFNKIYKQKNRSFHFYFSATDFALRSSIDLALNVKFYDTTSMDYF